jgi:DNA polymerase-3 subunit delta'
MLFKEVVGQQEIKIKMRGLIRNNRLSHALLLNAPEGAGGLPLALAFSQFLVCEKSAQADREENFPEESCNECPSCVRASRMIHPDIHYVYPVVTRKPGEKTVSTDYIPEWREFIAQNPYGNLFDWLQFIGAENKQGNISAQECSEINRKLNLKSFESGYKILILWMPEFLGNEGNKLLKLIEEPPPDTLFILVSENESQILPTILSRMQVIRLPGIPAPEIAQALRERTAIAADQAARIAAVSEQNFREALRHLQQEPDDWQEMARDWLNAILKTGPSAQVKWIEEISKAGREKQKQFLQFFIHLLEQAIRLRMSDNAVDGISPVELDFTKRLNRIAPLATQQAMVKEAGQAIYHIERNAHAKMLFHALTIRYYHFLATGVEPVVS